MSGRDRNVTLLLCLEPSSAARSGSACRAHCVAPVIAHAPQRLPLLFFAEHRFETFVKPSPFAAPHRSTDGVAQPGGSKPCETDGGNETAILLRSGSQTFIRSPLSCCAGVADFAGLCRNLPSHLVELV